MASQASISPQATWPGERHPSHLDVELANESLEPNFLGNFKRALLSSPAALNNEDLVHVTLENHSIEGFTYPISTLSDFPELPAEDDLDLLQQSFSQRFGKHLLLNSLPLPSQSQHGVPPYFKLVLACMTCAASSDAAVASDRRNQARKLWKASSMLWTVMLEVDNREARTLEGAITPILLSLYGMLTADVDTWNFVKQQLLPSASTILRRMRLHESVTSDGTATPTPLSGRKRSLVFGCMLLISVLTALHLDMPCYLTSNEVGFQMGPAPVHFQEMYANLLDDDSILAPAPGSREDAVLFLTTILSDSTCVRRYMGGLSDHVARQLQKLGQGHLETSPIYNPYPVFSPPSEYRRVSEQLSGALDRWKERFGSVVGRDELTLYYFCRLYLSCPHLSLLPKLAGYSPAIQTAGVQKELNPLEKTSISDESVQFAWAVLDHADGRSDADQVLCPIWFPLSVFFAALVVWARTWLHEETLPYDKPSGLKQLMAFKLELDRMPWPCCLEMSSTLDRLVQNSRGPGH